MGVDHNTLGSKEGVRKGLHDPGGAADSKQRCRLTKVPGNLHVGGDLLPRLFFDLLLSPGKRGCSLVTTMKGLVSGDQSLNPGV